MKSTSGTRSESLIKVNGSMGGEECTQRYQGVRSTTDLKNQEGTVQTGAVQNSQQPAGKNMYIDIFCLGNGLQT